jgi:repressor LexA
MHMPAIIYPKERIILDFIMQFIDRYGYAPTLKEIGDSCNMHSPATTHEHIEKLRQKGLIKKLDGTARGLEVIRTMYRNDQNASSPQLPVMGFIAAGQPLEPYTDPNYYMAVPPGMIASNKAGYLLQVKGQSMIEDGIMDGDFVVIQHQEDANNGDIVVAMLPNGLTTLKRIYFEKERIKLMPANSEMSPIFATHVKIQGKCVGLIRRFTH